MLIAKTPKPPYYAVIFTSIKSEDQIGYKAMSDKMVEMVQNQAGFIGFESASEDIGITVSYWESLESIRNWKQNIDHLEAQKKGKSDWYQHFKTRIAKVERDYEFEKS